MKKQKKLKIVNIFLGLIMLVQALTGIFHSLLPYELFRLVHGIGGWLLILFVIFHVVLNRGWIKANLINRTK